MAFTGGKYPGGPYPQGGTPEQIKAWERGYDAWEQSQKNSTGTGTATNTAPPQPYEIAKTATTVDANPYRTDKVDAMSDHIGGLARKAETNRYNESMLNKGAIHDPRQASTQMFGTQQGINAAMGQVGQANIARMGQQGQVGYLQQLQQGQGPSVGQLQANAGADRSQGLMRLAGSQAAQALQSSQAQAAGQYGSAMQNQGAMTRMAAQNAGYQLQDAGQDALRAQASLAASARGGMQGAALLNAQNNTAGANQRASIDAGRMMSSANMQASDQAAQGMLAAQQADLQSRLQTGGSLERSNINAANVGADMMLEGSKIRSAEQLAATGMVNDTLGGIRQQDLGAAGVAAGLANTALGADSQRAENDRFNVGNELEAAKANQANRLANAGMASNEMMAFNSQLQDLMKTGMSYEQAYAELSATLEDHNKDRIGNIETGNATNSANLQIARNAAEAQKTSAMIGGGAALAAGLIPLLSDRTAKKNIRKAPSAVDAIANFRKAKSHRYEYKSERDGRGTFDGPMAQDMPKGTQVKRPDGKTAIDTGRVAMLAASAIGEQQKRIDKLERRKR